MIRTLKTEKDYTVAENKLLDAGYFYHHAAAARGYISRRAAGTLEPYAGRFGTGYVIRVPRFDTTRYHYIYYYTK